MSPIANVFPAMPGPHLTSSRALSGKRVALFDRVLHEPSALGRRGSFHRFDRADVLGQIFVLDEFANPARIVAAQKMVDQGFVVDALGDLKEHLQVLRAQAEPAVWAAKVKA